MQNTIDTIDKKSFYDQTVVIDSGLVSIVKLVLYTPIGLILLVVRLIALFVLYLIALVLPDFTTTSKGFVRALLTAFGLYVTCVDENTDDSTSNKKTILIANHVSCFDYLALKSIYTNKMTLIRLNEDDNMCTRILYPGYNNCPEKRDKYEDIDIDDHLTGRPDVNRFLYFPENARTNGKFGLLSFNFDPFSSIIMDMDRMQSIEFSPVCIGHRRLFISNLCNPHADNLTNILITLFVPLTQITVKQLAVEDKQPDESLNAFAMRIQAKIGTYLNLKCTNVSNDALLVLDNGVNKLVMQVKSVLPHLNENLIKTFISTSESMDIDTLITNMLDKYAHIKPDAEVNKSTIAFDNTSSSSSSSSDNNNKQTSTSHTSQVVKRLVTYQERKQILLEEARSRFLQRQ